ncbi:ribosome recycling factor-domain-containing protein [Corynascus similis CBS 632.67]
MRPLRAANGILRSVATGSAPRRIILSSIHTLNPTTPSSHITSSTSSTGRNISWQRTPTRPFSHTVPCQKKKSKRGKDKTDEVNAEHDVPNSKRSSQKDTTAAAGGEAADAPDPFDFSDVQAAFDRADKHFTEDLKKLRSGGRFNADAIGAIPVQVDNKDNKQRGASSATFPLRELATVAPLGGRRWSILAFEESSVKPILSAVQRSEDFNQQPQRSEDNPLELTMTVEPERADALARRAKTVCQAWRDRVRDEARRRSDLHKKWRGDGLLLSDDAHKLKDKLQKLQDERMKGIQAKEKEVVAAIMARG